MLETLRKSANTWVFKIFFAILLASFSFFGLESFLGSGTMGNSIVQVGNQKVTPQEFDLSLGQAVAKVKKSLGKDAPIDQLMPMIQNQVIKSLTQQKLLDALAQETGLSISDELIKTMIAKEFSDDQGLFSVERFKIFLQQSGLSEKQFVDMAKKDMARSLLTGAVFPAIHAPKLLVQPLFLTYYTPRSFQLITLKSSDFPVLSLPSEKDLQTFYLAHKKKYATPERRVISVLFFPKETQETGATTSAASYKKLQELRDQIAGGTSLETIAQENSLKLETYGPVALDPKDTQSLKARIMSLGFYLAEEGLDTEGSDPATQQEFLVRVDKILPSVIPPLADIKSQIIVDFLAAQQDKALTKAVETFNNGFADATTSLSTIAGRYHRQPQSYINVNLASSPPPSLPPEVLTAVLAQPVGKGFAVQAGDTVYVGSVTGFGVLPTGTQATEGRNKVAEGLRTALTGAILQALLAEVEVKHSVQLNHGMLKQLQKSAS